MVRKINYNEAKEVSYQYNAVGELVQMDDWTGTNTFELDLLGRLQKMTDHKGNTVAYAYDAVGNQTSVICPDEIFEFFLSHESVQQNWLLGYNDRGLCHSRRYFLLDKMSDLWYIVHSDCVVETCEACDLKGELV